MLEFFTISVSTVLGFFIPTLEVISEFPQTAFSYGSVIEQINRPDNKQPSVTDFLFTGDIMLARGVEQLMGDYGPVYPFSEIQSLTKATDFTIGNFEAAVPVKHITTPLMTLRFSVHESFLERLQLAGFDYLSLANNHSYDYGPEGLLNSRHQLKVRNMITFGEPGRLTKESVTYVPLEGGRHLALLGLSALSRTYTAAELTALFTTINERSDIQIVYIHWGEEYKLLHSRRQKRLAQRLIEAGADAIIGHHPHVVQDIQTYRGIPIFYSLGNFVFDQYFSQPVQEGLLLKLTLTDSGARYELIPISSLGSRSIPRRMAPYEQANFLADLARRSAPELADQIRSGVIRF